MYAVFNKQTGIITCTVDAAEPELCCGEGEALIECDDSVTDAEYYVSNGNITPKKEIIIPDQEVLIGQPFTISLPEPAFCYIKMFDKTKMCVVDDGVIESVSEIPGDVIVSVEMDHYVCPPVKIRVKNED